MLMAGLFFCSILPAQKGLAGLLGAEKAFAAYTATHAIREGFLTYMDSTGLVFKSGKAVNAVENYRNQPAGKAILSWKPDFAVISAGGDMGVTAGPYELRAEHISDKPIAKGNFSSVWKINSNGEWKNIADLGTGYPVELNQDNSIFTHTLENKNPKTTSFEQVREADSIFNLALAHHNTALLEKYLTVETRLQQNGQIPITGIDKVIQGLLTLPSGTTLQYMGGGIATKGDLAYIYGITSQEDRQENYLRAWVFRQNKWKLILQTIRW